MVFWTSYPITHYFKGIYPLHSFISLQFTKQYIKSPTGKEAEIYTFENNENSKQKLQIIQFFLKTYFGNPPKTPILNIPISELLNFKDTIIIVNDLSNNIVGCIRYKYIGKLIINSENIDHDIYCEDCFCIHPDWRKKGLGDYILTVLHNYVNKNNIPYSIFIKEGTQLGIILKPMYSSYYVYTSTKNIQNQNQNPENIQNISPEKALKIMNIFQEFFEPNKYMIIHNPNNINQIWKLYSNNVNKILVCFQDTYQITYNNLDENIDKSDNYPKRIGWITAWFETKNIPDNIKEIAINELINSVKDIFDYIWANSEWIPNSMNWKKDGPFHIYNYQWATNINIKKNYCITL
jgi:hypothetical protein